MTVNGGNEMKALLLKTSVWLVLLFSVMGLWQVSNAAEQHTPMKAQVVTTIDKATTDKQLVPPIKEAAHHSGEEAATNISAQGTADDTNNKVTSNAPSNKPSTAVSTKGNETRDVDTQQASTQNQLIQQHSHYQMLKQHHFHHECLLPMHHKQRHIKYYIQMISMAD